jgi:hypothetical protein
MSTNILIPIPNNTLSLTFPLGLTADQAADAERDLLAIAAMGRVGLQPPRVVKRMQAIVAKLEAATGQEAQLELLRRAA